MGAPAFDRYSSAPDFSSPWRESAAVPARRTSRSATPARRTSRSATPARRTSRSVAPARRQSGASAPSVRLASAAPAPRTRPARTPEQNPARRSGKQHSRTYTNNGVRVVRGKRTPDLPAPSSTSAQTTAQIPVNITAVVCVVAALLIGFSLLSFARVAISSATISASMSTQAQAAELEVAKSEGNQLEVSACVASNATSVNDRARALGMTNADAVEYIELSPDVVVQDASGNLDLTESIRRAGQTQSAAEQQSATTTTDDAAHSSTPAADAN